MERCLFHKDEEFISLIPKDESNLTTLSNLRPITLLNEDYKILAKVIARRIESVLPKLIHSDQTGFIKGRFIGQNVRLLNDLLECTDVRQIPQSVEAEISQFADDTTLICRDIHLTARTLSYKKAKMNKENAK